MSPKATEISAGTAPVVSVVILNFNGGDDTIHCLSSVLNETVASVSFEVIVVDNGSTDDSAEAIARQFPQIRLIETGSNLGFSRGANLGAAAASGEFVAFLNNDVRVDSEWLSPLVHLLRRDVSLAAAGCTIMSWEGTLVEFSGIRGDAFSLS